MDIIALQVIRGKPRDSVSHIMAKLDWRRAKTYRAEWEPTGSDTAEWVEQHRAQVRALKLTCRACAHQGKVRARLDARFVCSRCGSHRVKPTLDL